MHSDKNETIPREKQNDNNAYLSAAFKIASELAMMGQPVENTLKYLLDNDNKAEAINKKDED